MRIISFQMIADDSLNNIVSPLLPNNSKPFLVPLDQDQSYSITTLGRQPLKLFTFEVTQQQGVAERQNQPW